MSEHLLAMAIGPVQDFIAAARRTRDLWFGSHVLSEISKAAAKAVADQVGLGALIFPAPQAADDLAPHDTEAKLEVANVILARLPSGAVPADVAKAAKQAAETRWREFANAAFDEVAGAVDAGIWESQVNDVVEFYAAWKALASDDAYMKYRKDVMRLLAGRKACRDFVTAYGVPGVPKSSLDGARESVLDSRFRKAIRDHRSLKTPLTKEQTTWLRQLRLTGGEELDVIGL